MPKILSWDKLGNKKPNGAAFIIGGSPSILDEPLHLLKDQRVYLCNKSWKALEMGLLEKANGICYTGLSSYEEHVDEMNAFGLANIRKYYSDLIVTGVKRSTFKVKGDPNEEVYVFPKRVAQMDNNKSLKNNLYLPDTIEDGLGKTGSVTLDMAVLCYLMGFKDIYLLGMDLDYTTAQYYFFEGNSWDRKVSAPTLRLGIHNCMCNLAEAMARKRVNLKNISLGYNPELYAQHTDLTIDTDTLQNVLGSYVKPKAIGLIHGDFYPLNEHDCELIGAARKQCDKLIVSCTKESMTSVMKHVRFVDGAIHCDDEQQAVARLCGQYPNDRIRLFHNDKSFTVHNAT
tara:strand:- start:5619 stop:6647 length:1029 start_codon:yes stop_codon:yes gene_type:complete